VDWVATGPLAGWLMGRWARTFTALLTAVVALGSLSATAAAKAASGPDLTIVGIAIKELPGAPPYVLLDQSARAPGFVVAVSVKNIGGERSGRSVVDLKLEQKGKTISPTNDEFLGPLPPHGKKPKVVKLVVRGLSAEPGFLTATATVKWKLTKTRTRHESDSAPPIPVIPHDWNVGYFHATLNQAGTGAIIDTYAELKLAFTFSRFDEAAKKFVYTPNGQVTLHAQYNAGGCSGNGSTNAAQNPWPGTESELLITGELTQYFAGVVTSAQPPLQLMVTCPALNNYSFPFSAPWFDLATVTGSGANPSMTPDQTSLTGEGSKPTPAGPIKFTWNFTARLSGA